LLLQLFYYLHQYVGFYFKPKGDQTVKLQIPPPQQVSLFVPSKYDILIYGPNGTGKTIFGATWSEAGNVLFADSDEGILSVRTSTIVQHKDRIFHVPVKDSSEDPHVKIPIGYLTVKQILTDLKETREYGEIRPKTVVLDSATTLGAFAMTHTLFVNKRLEPVLKDWGNQMKRLTDLIMLARSIPDINFIFIAHEQYTKDEISGQIWCLPLITGKLAAQLGLYFDEVYHAVVQQVGDKSKYLLQTKPTGIITAKSRFDLPSPIPNHYSSIAGSIEKLKGDKK
jgi:hypothetical protein